ncbi:ATP-binding protein [Psychrobacillus vulpis]|uniref:histidine kinase n=1 Tax=Psychrobacillus vulpis TaxID=2325572 RepID=A0A544TJA1_9BACI|nr:ATP-binding protein [Psychrobacillus vulpis]TQR17542.1 sensor histidine kinase [Psychrobacillus vulpis]
MGIPTLLLNAFIIILCIFCYQVFWLDKDRSNVRNNILISFLSSTACVLCMTFPFSYHFGYIYDLRLIPIVLAFLYGGLRSFVFVTFVYLTYRFYLGGTGFIPSVIIMVIMYFTIITILNFSQSDYIKKRRPLFGILLIFIWISTFSAFTIFNGLKIYGTVSSDFLQFLCSYLVINILTGLLSIYLIEGMIDKVRMKEKIQRAEKFYVISELAASFAHEIRNPLTSVYGFIQLFHKNEIAETSKDEYYQVILEELERIQLIVDNYLSLGELQNNVIKDSLDISVIVNQVINCVSPLAMLNNIEIKSSINDSLSINANADKINQCLINIIKNGIEAMKNGGILRINGKKGKNSVVIEIVDSGIGMTPEEIKRIAMPFYSLKEEGTGLGTMIAYGIIKELNGDIEIKSEKGKGTCFTIIIPSL